MPSTKSWRSFSRKRWKKHWNESGKWISQKRIFLITFLVFLVMPLGIYNSFGDFALFFISSFFNIIIIIVISFALLYKNHITTSRSYPDNNHLKISRLIPFFLFFSTSLFLFISPLRASFNCKCVNWLSNLLPLD